MKKILLIEDEKQLGRMYKTKLEADKFKVVWFQDGIKVIDKIEQEKPDLILLDIVMPKISGLDVLKEMKKKGLLKKILVLVITNSALKNHCQKALELGAIDCLYKYHFTPTTLSKKIKIFLS